MLYQREKKNDTEKNICFSDLSSQVNFSRIKREKGSEPTRKMGGYISRANRERTH